MSNVLIQFPTTKFLDERGEISKAWRQWLLNPQVITINLSEAISISSGGTGLVSVPGAGQLLIGNGAAYVLSTLTAGAGIGIGNGLGSITVSNDGVVSLTAGVGIGVSGSTGNVTVSNIGVTALTAGAGIGVSASAGNITVSNVGVTALAGTANQVIVSASVGSVTISLPQSIATTNTPTFSGVSVAAINGNTVTTGSFTITLTGFTAGVTGTAIYSITNNVVTLFIPILTGTSNAGTMTATGIPAAITPATTHAGFPVGVEDNTVQPTLPGRADVLTNNTMQFFLKLDGTAFTNSGTKGLPFGLTVTYNLN